MANIESGGGLLTPLQQLPTSGARAAEVFTTDEGTFLAVPQLARDVAGEPPYMNGGDSDIEAPIYRWHDGRFVEHEALSLSGGEDLEYFEIDGRRFEFAVTQGRLAGAHGEPSVTLTASAADLVTARLGASDAMRKAALRRIGFNGDPDAVDALRRAFAL